MDADLSLSRSPTDTTTTYRRYGVGVEVCGPPLVVKAVADRLPPVPAALAAELDGDAQPPVCRRYEVTLRDGSSEIHRFDLRMSDLPAVEDLPLDRLLHIIESDAKLWITSTTAQVVFVHAGVVAWRGRALVLPGRSHAGKTTLVGALIRKGAVYYSDDYAVLDSEGCVWPCPLMLAQRDGEGLRSFVTPSSLGAEVGDSGIPLGWVLDTRYEKGAVLEPQRMSPAETALCLLDNAPAARLRPADVLRVLALACRDTIGLVGARGEADSEAETILGTLLAT